MSPKDFEYILNFRNYGRGLDLVSVEQIKDLPKKFVEAIMGMNNPREMIKKCASKDKKQAFYNRVKQLNLDSHKLKAWY